MIIKGLVKLSLIDFPGRLSAVIFTAGCNFRCPFCHNRDLVLNNPNLPEISLEYVFSYLKEKVGMIDGVCVTGGEPTLNTDLPEFLKTVRSLGYEVKLDTNGTNPRMLNKLISEGSIDYIAMDLKSSFDENYLLAAQSQNQTLATIFESIKLIIESGIEYEFRTTVVPSLHTPQSLAALASQLKEHFSQALGGRSLRWYLQSFRPGNCLDGSFNSVVPFSDSQLQSFQFEISKLIPSVKLRV